MSLFMSQFSYTAEAWQALTKNPEDRAKAVRALLEKLGAKLHSLYYSFGEYDGVVIYEAPDESTATAFILAATSPGHLKSTKTTTLLTVEQTMQAMRKAGGATFKGPKAG